MVEARRLVVPLDPESVRSIIGRVYPLLRLASDVVVDVSEDTLELRVPRAVGLGHRRVKLGLRVYEFEDAVVLIAKGERESLVVTVDIVDTGEGTHVIVSGSASGRVQKILGRIVDAVASGVESRVSEAKPKISIIEDDTRVAKSSRPPRYATLVYYDSFTPVSNVVDETALRLISMLGYDDYLVEVQDYSGRYLLRMVIRTRTVTGAYASVKGQVAQGLDAVKIASKPPGARVRVKAWSLTGRSEARILEPVPVYESEAHRVYWLGFSGGAEPTLTPSQYLVVDGEEAAIIGCGGLASRSRVWRCMRSLIEDLDRVKYVILNTSDAANTSGVSWLLEKLPSAALVASCQAARVLGELEAKPKRVIEVGYRGRSLLLGSVELSIIPVKGCTPLGFMVYDPSAAILFPGPVIGAITPPGLWRVFVDDKRDARLMVLSYIASLKTSLETIMDFINNARRLEVKVLALSYGTVIRGEAVDAVLEALEDYARRGGGHS